MHAAYLI